MQIRTTVHLFPGESKTVICVFNTVYILQPKMCSWNELNYQAGLGNQNAQEEVMNPETIFAPFLVKGSIPYFTTGRGVGGEAQKCGVIPSPA